MIWTISYKAHTGFSWVPPLKFKKPADSTPPRSNQFASDLLKIEGEIIVDDKLLPDLYFSLLRHTHVVVSF